jgi:hemolysin activation/secretion protein
MITKQSRHSEKNGSSMVYALICAVVFGALFVGPRTSFAAEGQDYASLERRLKAVETQLAIQDSIIKSQQAIIEKMANMSPEIKKMTAAPEKTVLVKKFVMNGANLFTAKDFKPILSKYKGKELSMTQLKGIADELTAFYRSKGYVSSQVSLPTQEIAKNTVEFTVVEGRIGEVTVEGGKYYKAELLERQVTLKEGQVLDYGKLNKDIRRMNDHPGRTVQAVLEPGAEQGTSNVVVKMKEEKRPWHLTADYANNGTKYTTQDRYGLGFVHNNFLGNDDILTVKGRMGDKSDIYSYSGDYNTPLSFVGLNQTKVGGYFMHSNSVIGDVFEVLNPSGDGTIWGLYAAHPWLDTDWAEPFPITLKSSVSFGFDSISTLNKVLNEETSRDEIRVFKPGVSIDEKDEWGRTFISEQFHFGVNGLGANKKYDDTSSRLDASSQFFKNTGNFSRITRLPFSSYLVTNFKYQYANDPLLSPEQFVIGGADTVRGYPENEFFGDLGYCATSELRTPAFVFPWQVKVPFDKKTSLCDALQFAYFIDWGQGVLLKPRPGELKDLYLVGAGVGLVIDLYGNVKGRLDVGFPLNKTPSDNSEATLHARMSYEW